MFYIAHKQNKTKQSVETGFMVILYFKCKTVILQGHFYFWVTKYYQCQMYILDCILQICSMSWPITIMRSREPCIIYNVIWNSNNISVLNVVILSSVACPSLPLHFRLEHVIVFKQQPYMRQFTACSVLKEKRRQWPLFHSISSMLSCPVWAEALFSLLSRSMAGSVEHVLIISLSFHHNLSLCLSSLLMSSHCLPLQEVQSWSKLLWMPISGETLHSVSASNVSFSSSPVLGFGFFPCLRIAISTCCHSTLS